MKGPQGALVEEVMPTPETGSCDVAQFSPKYVKDEAHSSCPNCVVSRPTLLNDQGREAVVELYHSSAVSFGGVLLDAEFHALLQYANLGCVMLTWFPFSLLQQSMIPEESLSTSHYLNVVVTILIKKTVDDNIEFYRDMNFIVVLSCGSDNSTSANFLLLELQRLFPSFTRASTFIRSHALSSDQAIGMYKEEPCDFLLSLHLKYTFANSMVINNLAVEMDKDVLKVSKYR
ncbi:hypothetical protein Tco_1029180 [Tanacetum coccineum]|uniref:Uncharacterized protein n=1 Tax=Tanacetum coccineum TaxID=301880 RepID=A0ABQ5G2Q5_9ASTR